MDTLYLLTVFAAGVVGTLLTYVLFGRCFLRFITPYGE